MGNSSSAKKANGWNPHQTAVDEKSRWNCDVRDVMYKHVSSQISCMEDELCHVCLEFVPKETYSEHPKTKSHEKEELRLLQDAYPYSCPKCDVRFCRMVDLQPHHSVHNMSATYQNQPDQAFKPFFCFLCRLQFNNNSDLEKHHTRSLEHAHRKEMAMEFAIRRKLISEELSEPSLKEDESAGNTEKNVERLAETKRETTEYYCGVCSLYVQKTAVIIHEGSYEHQHSRNAYAGISSNVSCRDEEVKKIEETAIFASSFNQINRKNCKQDLKVTSNDAEKNCLSAGHGRQVLQSTNYLEVLRKAKFYLVEVYDKFLALETCISHNGDGTYFCSPCGTSAGCVEMIKHVTTKNHLACFKAGRPPVNACKEQMKILGYVKPVLELLKGLGLKGGLSAVLMAVEMNTESMASSASKIPPQDHPKSEMSTDECSGAAQMVEEGKEQLTNKQLEKRLERVVLSVLEAFERYFSLETCLSRVGGEKFVCSLCGVGLGNGVSRVMRHIVGKKHLSLFKVDSQSLNVLREKEEILLCLSSVQGSLTGLSKTGFQRLMASLMSVSRSTKGMASSPRKILAQKPPKSEVNSDTVHIVEKDEEQLSSRGLSLISSQSSSSASLSMADDTGIHVQTTNEIFSSDFEEQKLDKTKKLPPKLISSDGCFQNTQDKHSHCIAVSTDNDSQQEDSSKEEIIFVDYKEVFGEVCDDVEVSDNDELECEVCGTVFPIFNGDIELSIDMHVQNDPVHGLASAVPVERNAKSVAEMAKSTAVPAHSKPKSISSSREPLTYGQKRKTVISEVLSLEQEFLVSEKHNTYCELCNVSVKTECQMFHHIVSSQHLSDKWFKKLSYEEQQQRCKGLSLLLKHRYAVGAIRAALHMIESKAISKGACQSQNNLFIKSPNSQSGKIVSSLVFVPSKTPVPANSCGEDICKLCARDLSRMTKVGMKNHLKTCRPYFFCDVCKLKMDGKNKESHLSGKLHRSKVTEVFKMLDLNGSLQVQNKVENHSGMPN